ncbi:MAG: lipase [Cypionkella sp.]|nr:lipase [Cypionkella sp.]
MQDLYRNRDFIPDFDAIMLETAARSRELAARVEIKADVAYGASVRERMDILLPPSLAKGAPLHMFIHGGYWRAGSKTDHHLVAAPVLAAGGIAAIVTYDLMPVTRLGRHRCSDTRGRPSSIGNRTRPWGRPRPLYCQRSLCRRASGELSCSDRPEGGSTTAKASTNPRASSCQRYL